MSTKDKILYFLILHRTGLAVSAFAAFVLLFPLYQDNPYTLGLTNLIALNTIVVLGLNLFIGYAGQISLGHAAFFGLGAYGSALLTVEGGIPPWGALLLTALAVAAIAWLVGRPILRLHGHYLAMATLGLNLVVYTILVQADKVTGGPSGFAGIPPLALGDWAIDDEIRFHYLAWGTALVCLLISLNLVRSGVGRGLAALAADEQAAQSLGIDTARAKVRIFVLSAVLASLGGSLFAHCYRFVSPDSFGIFVSVDFVIMVVIGGLGSVWGTLLGTSVVTMLPEWIEVFDTYKDIIYGLILVVILMFLPRGLVSGLIDLARNRFVLWIRKNAASRTDQ